MPYHSDTPVARIAAGVMAKRRSFRRLGISRWGLAWSSGPQGFGYGCLHRVKLMVARHQFGQSAAAIVCKHDEIAKHLQEVLWVADSLQHYLQLRQGLCG